jgi:signal transduction histidine kinase
MMMTATLYTDFTTQGPDLELQAEKIAAMTQLAAGLAHEVNSPVGALQCGADTVQRCLSRIYEALEASDHADQIRQNPDFCRALRTLGQTCATVHKASNRIAEVAASLGAFSGLDRASYRQVDIRQCIEDTLSLISARLRGRIRLVRDFAEVSPVLCHANELNQVWMSLLASACDAIDGRGEIVLQVRQKGQTVRVEVEDSGRARVNPGQGLKLAYAIVIKHGGSLVITSRPEGGTRVTVTLPLHGRHCAAVIQ